VEDLLKGKKLKGMFINMRHPIYWVYDYERKRRRPFQSVFHSPFVERSRIDSVIYKTYPDIRITVGFLYKILPR